MTKRIITVQDARRERYEAEARVELKARDREIKRLRALGEIASRSGFTHMADRYGQRVAKLEAR